MGSASKNVKVQVSFSGCPNGCARHLTADIGLQGSAVRLREKMWRHTTFTLKTRLPAALGKLVERGIRAEDAKFAVANLIEAYLKSHSGLTFPEFCMAKSLEELQAIISPT